MTMSGSLLCLIGLHKWLPVMRPNPDPQTVWLFGPFVVTERECCARCKAGRVLDLTDSDYD
jgi:hypothetical protein